MTGLKLIIFDCDGVLFDSRRANKEYYNRICTLAGRPPIEESEFSYCHMHTADESIEYLFRNYPDLLDRARQFAKEVRYDEFIEFMELEPGVSEVMEELKRRDLFTAISTNRSTTMPLLIKTFRLRLWFDEIVCALDVKHPKPHPEGVFKIIDRFGVQKNACIYIGDSKVDEEVAGNAGIPLIAYKNPDLNAMFHVKHFMELLEIIK